MENSNLDPLQTIQPAPTFPSSPTVNKKPIIFLLAGLMVIIILGGVLILLPKNKTNDSKNGLVTVPSVTISATPFPSETVPTVDSGQLVESSIKNVFVGNTKNPTGATREFGVTTPVVYTHIDFIPTDQEVPGKITATLINVSTGDKLGPVGVDVTTAEPQGADFSFSKPTKGWPKGDQKILIEFGKSSRVYIFTIK